MKQISYHFFNRKYGISFAEASAERKLSSIYMAGGGRGTAATQILFFDGGRAGISGGNE